MYISTRAYRKAEEELVPLAVYAISETASQDGKVGGPIRVVTVFPTGSKELTETEVDDIVKRNLARITVLRDSFYEGRTTV